MFLMWTLCLYSIHILAHRVPLLRTLHRDHHAHIRVSNNSKWHWSNLLLFNDTWTSTADLWCTEVIPTLIFSAITGHWWISVFYYLWAALLQEALEHNPNNNWYPFTAGKWHLVHHQNSTKNYGLFIPLWDKLFKTEKHVT
jgi:sterol desaturase/sphingolipid hydroxylase (fatty acid hydroxylase superfamily)